VVLVVEPVAAVDLAMGRKALDVGEQVTRESIATLREDIADIERRLDHAEARAPELPYREQYLLLVTSFLRRLLGLHLEFVDDVDRELGRETIASSDR
jgi:hypothetical protein